MIVIMHGIYPSMGVHGAGERILVLCAPEDMWMPLWKWDQMLKSCPGIQACTLLHTPSLMFGRHEAQEDALYLAGGHCLLIVIVYRTIPPEQARSKQCCSIHRCAFPARGLAAPHVTV